MCTYCIGVQIESDLAQHIDADGLLRVAQAVLKQSSQPQNAGVTVVIVDDQRIRQLNREFRGVDRATDVLAFGFGEDPGFVTPEELSPHLGDVVVSYPAALAQSAAVGHSLKEELTLLVVHGCLHLLGYDDATEEDSRQMWARQEELLQSLR